MISKYVEDNRSPRCYASPPRYAPPVLEPTNHAAFDPKRDLTDQENNVDTQVLQHPDFDAPQTSPAHLQRDQLRSYMGVETGSPVHGITPTLSEGPPLLLPSPKPEPRTGLGCYEAGAEIEPIEVTSRRALRRRETPIVQLATYRMGTNAPPVMFAPGLAPRRLDGLNINGGNVTSGNMGAATARQSVGIRKPRRTKTRNQTPSKFCHICLRRGERIRVIACTNVGRGTCRKVVCEKCFRDYKWEWKSAVLDPAWTCCHCRGVCPDRAQCFIYRRTNDRRHQALMLKKEEAERRELPADIVRMTNDGFGTSAHGDAEAMA